MTRLHLSGSLIQNSSCGRGPARPDPGLTMLRERERKRVFSTSPLEAMPVSMRTTPPRTRERRQQDLQETTAKVLIGVDVAKARLDTATRWRDESRPVRRATYPNTPAGIRRLLRLVRRQAPAADLHVVMEATGTYHLALATALADAGLLVSVVNPVQIKRYRQMRLRRAKTDRADALLIAEYATREPMRRFRPGSPAQQHLKQIARTLAHLAKQQTALRNVLHAGRYLPAGSARCREELEAVRATLTAAMRRLRAEQARLARVVQADAYRLMRSIPGIGPGVAGALIGYAGDLSRFTHAKQLAAFVGIVPQPDQSGSREGPRRISKAGHAPLRALLYMGAITAMRHNRSCRALYQRLRARGKPHKVAAIAVANKLVRQLFAVVKSGVPYADNYEEKRCTLA